MAALYDPKIPVRLKLAALWASTVLCYLYCDYFELYTPGKLQSMLEGRIDPIGAVTQGVLVATSLLLLVPSLMVMLSVVLPAALSRWVNVLFGILYTALMLLIAFSSGWRFYQMFAVVEAAMTAAIAWIAWRWPRLNAANDILQ